MKPEKSISIWSLLIKSLAVVGLGISFFAIWGISQELLSNPQSRNLPLVWGFGFLLGPLLLIFCWRLFVQKRWAGIAVCLLGWWVTYENLSAPWHREVNWLTVAGAIAAILLPAALIFGGRDWHKGI